MQQEGLLLEADDISSSMKEGSHKSSFVLSSLYLFNGTRSIGFFWIPKLTLYYNVKSLLHPRTVSFPKGITKLFPIYNRFQGRSV